MVCGEYVNYSPHYSEGIKLKAKKILLKKNSVYSTSPYDSVHVWLLLMTGNRIVRQDANHAQ